MIRELSLHDLTAWAQIPTPIQEKIIGRTKIDNIEIGDDNASRKSHKSLATIVDAGGNEYDILRDNMPFGRPGHREFGTYFIGYSRYLWVIEKYCNECMLATRLALTIGCSISRHRLPAQHSLRHLARRCKDC